MNYKAAEIIDYLGNCFNKQLRETTIKAYVNTTMQYMTEDQLKVACKELAVTAKFFPSIAEIIEVSRRYQPRHRETPVGSCEQCQSTGFRYIDNVAYRCRCEFGQELSDIIRMIP